jgi:hypothetical protein
VGVRRPACGELRAAFAPTAQWRLDPRLTAFLTSAAILFSSTVVNFVNAKEVGHMAPSSRFAASWKPNVEYLDWY